MKSLDLGCGVGSGRNSEDVFYVSETLKKNEQFNVRKGEIMSLLQKLSGRTDLARTVDVMIA